MLRSPGLLSYRMISILAAWPIAAPVARASLVIGHTIRYFVVLLPNQLVIGHEIRYFAKMRPYEG